MRVQPIYKPAALATPNSTTGSTSCKMQQRQECTPRASFKLSDCDSSFLLSFQANKPTTDGFCIHVITLFSVGFREEVPGPLGSPPLELNW